MEERKKGGGCIAKRFTKTDIYLRRIKIRYVRTRRNNVTGLIITTYLRWTGFFFFAFLLFYVNAIFQDSRWLLRRASCIFYTFFQSGWNSNFFLWQNSCCSLKYASLKIFIAFFARRRDVIVVANDTRFFLSIFLWFLRLFF